MHLLAWRCRFTYGIVPTSVTNVLNLYSGILIVARQSTGTMLRWFRISYR